MAEDAVRNKIFEYKAVSALSGAVVPVLPMFISRCSSWAISCLRALRGTEWGKRGMNGLLWCAFDALLLKQWNC